MKRLFCVKNQKGGFCDVKGRTYTDDKMEAKRARDFYQEKKPSSSYHVSKGPDHRG